VSKPPSWNQIRANAATFATRWADTTQENAEAQTFWNEFLAVFGVDRKRVASFEKRAQRDSTKGRGRIDLFWAGTLIAEHKSSGKDLAEAEFQALDYLNSVDEGDFPGVVLTSDFQRMRVLDLGGDNTPYEFPISNLVNEVDRFGFIAGYQQRHFSAQEEAAANIQAARLMGRLYEQLAAAGYEGHEASVLMTRLLFLLFGDDTGMWEKSLFFEFIESRTQPDGSDLGAQLSHLFQILDTPTEKRSKALDEFLDRFPYVNGGLFHDRLNIPSFDHEMRDELLACCSFDWGTISPAIFGSMFQAVKSKEARRELGEHYTTEHNILKVINPLFMDGLRADLEKAKHSVKGLQTLRARLGKKRFLDPACGCGNFLVIAYREMRALELDILKALRDLTGQEQLSLDATLGLQVSLDQFYGIELEEWPARIAETAMFLVDHQANKELEREFGQAPDRLPIVIAATIRLANAAQTDWAEVLPASDDVVVLGNPPFIGMAWTSADQQADNRTAFAGINAKGLRSGRLDYVAVWYAKAIGYLKGTRGRAAFVSTNSITQGEQARTFEPLLRQNGYQIDFAHRTFKWTSEAPNAAAVHVVVVGFSEGGVAPKKRLFDYPTLTAQPVEVEAKRINAYLVDFDGEVPTKRYEPLLSGLPMASKGSQPTDGGYLIVSPEEHALVASDPIAAKYLRPYRQSTEMLYSKERWCLWLVDASPTDLVGSQILRTRLEGVKSERAQSATESVREQAKTPALFTQIRQPKGRYLALPEVSSENRDYIPGRYFDSDVIAGNKLICWPDAPLWLFGYLQSAMFTAWAKTFAGRLKSDFSISPSTVYFTFPFIEPTGKALTRVEAAAQNVLAARDGYPDETLASLYSPLAMPGDLRAAHVALDAEIDALYGLRKPTEGRRLTALLSRYNTLAAPLDESAKSIRRQRPKRVLES
jgi:hypothetical protein